MIGSERLRILPSDHPLVSVDTPGAMSRVACVVASLVTIRTLMVVAGVLYVALGAWLALDVHLYYDDAVARTALASFVISGRDPHLASIGSVWNPVPSIVEVPLLLFLRPLNTSRELVRRHAARATAVESGRPGLPMCWSARAGARSRCSKKRSVSW